MKKILGKLFLVALVAILLIAILEAFGLTAPVFVGTLLVVVSLVTGFINVTEKEKTGFLVSALAIGVPAGVGAISGLANAIPLLPLATIVESFLRNLALLVMPSAVVVAVSSVIKVSRN